jgi:hypothetical protein
MELGMMNDEGGIVGVGSDLMIFENSKFKIQHLTFDRSS